MNDSESSIFFSISATNSTKNMAYFSRSSFADPEIENYLSDQMPVGSLYCSEKSTQKLGQTEWLLHISLVLCSLSLSTQTLVSVKICNWWILHTFYWYFECIVMRYIAARNWPNLYSICLRRSCVRLRPLSEGYWTIAAFCCIAAMGGIAQHKSRLFRCFVLIRFIALHMDLLS